MRRRVGIVAAALALAAAAAVSRVGAQTTQGDELSRALDLEGSGKMREAASLFKAAATAPNVNDDNRVAALLGLERAYAALGYTDSVLVVLEPVLRTRPQDPTLRGIQLRSLRTLGRDEELRGAFEQWRRVMPGDPAPYREYARLLLQSGRAQAADTVLRLAQRMLRGARELAFERAQLHAALGAWGLAGTSWREALDVSPYAEQAAIFALQAAPPAYRDSVRTALLAPPVALGPRRVASTLLLAWRMPREAWAALAELAPNDSAVAAWGDFAERAEQGAAWSASRDAWLAVHGARKGPDALERAAAAALGANDPAGTLTLLDQLASLTRGTPRASTTALRVQALARLGRAAEAQALVERASAGVDAAERARLASLVADAWVRAGDVAKANAALVGAGAADAGEAAGWLALYAGDLKRARGLLKRMPESGSGPALSMTALSLLARVRADSAPLVGEAFLAATRGDTTAAVERFEAAARALPDAASILLGAAARLRQARGDAAGAEALWRAIATDHATSPEAPEAELEWARALLRRGDRAAAVERFEHLILTYPRSALVPLARRELEAARAG